MASPSTVPTEDDAPAYDRLWFAIVQARSRMREAMETGRLLEPLGLTERSFVLLSIACAGRGHAQREIVEEMFIDARQVVHLVDGLEEAGLIERRPHELDRRKKVIVATPAGLEMQQRAARLVDGAEAAILDGLDEAEQAQLRRLLHRVAPGHAATD